MVVIRLARRGMKRKPFYNIVVTEKSSPRDGNHIERLGYHNPVAAGQEKALEIDLERLAHWVGNGAQLSPTVARLVKQAKKTLAETAGA